MEMALPDEHWCEGVETSIKMARRYGHQKMGIPENKGEINRVREQLPRAHDDDHQLLERRGLQDWVRPVHAGVVMIPYNDIGAFKRPSTRTQ